MQLIMENGILETQEEEVPKKFPNDRIFLEYKGVQKTIKTHGGPKLDKE